MPMHFGPLHVTVYADGFTSDGPRACGAAGGDCAEPASRFVELVDCPACRRSKAYRKAARHFAATAQHFVPEEQQIESMRWRYVRRGVYRVARNNDFRERLGLPAVFPDPWTLPVLRARMEARRQAYARLREDADIVRAEAQRLGMDVVSVRSTDPTTGQSIARYILVEDKTKKPP